MGRIWALSAWTLCLVPVLASSAWAETFLGEEGEKLAPDKPSPPVHENSPVSPATIVAPTTTVRSQSEEVPSLPDDADEQAPVDDERPPPIKRMHRPGEESDESSGSGSGDEGHVTFSGEVGAGSGFVSGQATVGYYFARYVGVETSYYYYKFDTDSSSGSQYGPEVDLVVRLFNPYLLVPIAGAGPGYTTWHRSYNSKSFSSSSSFTGNFFYGLDLNLTKHFGIEVTRKLETDFGTRPVSFSDRVSHDPRSAWSTNIGFRVLF